MYVTRAKIPFVKKAIMNIIRKGLIQKNAPPLYRAAIIWDYLKIKLVFCTIQ